MYILHMHTYIIYIYIGGINPFKDKLARAFLLHLSASSFCCDILFFSFWAFLFLAFSDGCNMHPQTEPQMVSCV